VYPVRVLREAGHEVRGCFFNPNIHPYQEFARRVQAVEEFAGQAGMPVIWDRSYDLEDWLRLVAFREAERCRLCYYLRLSRAARIARSGNLEGFSTTLLYSKFQKHDLIREVGEQVAREVGIPFYYEDFRVGWAEGVADSKAMGLYRQQYCGCIYSERDRFQPPAKGKRSGSAQGADG
jgi:hypothetical protein